MNAEYILALALLGLVVAYWRRGGFSPKRRGRGMRDLSNMEGEVVMEFVILEGQVVPQGPKYLVENGELRAFPDYGTWLRWEEIHGGRIYPNLGLRLVSKNLYPHGPTLPYARPVSSETLTWLRERYNHVESEIAENARACKYLQELEAQRENIKSALLPVPER